MSTPELSVILVVGRMRERGQRSLDALCAQTAVERLEIVVVDMTPDVMPRIDRIGARGSEATVIYRDVPPRTSFVRARIAGLAASRAEVVAFVEEHAFAEPDWAEALLEAHRGPWAAIGYAIVDDNPESWVARASGMADYGYWAHPTPSIPVRNLPSHNVSYKRRVLIERERDLELLLCPDQILHQRLLRDGERLFLEGRARIRHQNFSNVLMLWQTNFAYGRLYAGHRARAFGLGTARRAALGLVAVTLEPAHRAIHLARGLRGRGLWRDALLVLPILPPSFAATAAGVCVGYWWGPGRAEATLTSFDFERDKLQ